MSSFARIFLLTLVLTAQFPTDAHAMGMGRGFSKLWPFKKKPAPTQPASSVTTYDLRVQAVDEDSRDGIAGAAITVLDMNRNALAANADSSGTASFRVPGGTYDVKVEAAGFRPYEIRLQVLGSTSRRAYLEAHWNNPTQTADFDFSQVTIIGGSPGDIRNWRVTSQITAVGFAPGKFHINHTRRGTWPGVDIDPGPEEVLQEATAWIFFKINGRWYGTGGERMRPSQTDKMLDRASMVGSDWFYDPNRWGPMAGYVPTPGELVGFMISSGSQRADNSYHIQERSSVVLIPFPADGVDGILQRPFSWEEQ